MREPRPDAEYLEELRRVHEQCGRVPLQQDLEEFGQYSLRPYEDRWESWNAALEAAGFDPADKEMYPKQVSNEELLEEVHRLVDALDRIPSVTDVRYESTHSMQTYYDRWDSWDDVLEAAGIDPDADRGRPRQKRISDAELLEDVRRLADEHGEPVTVTMVEEHGTFSYNTYQTRWDSWDDVLEDAGVEIGPDHPPHKISDEELIAELERLADEHGNPLSATAIRDHGEYSSKTYRDRFGSIAEMRAAADLEKAETNARQINEEDLLAELQRLADEHGTPVTAADISEHGRFAMATYYRRFESLGDAREKAGL